MKNRVKSIKTTPTKVVAVVWVGRDEENYGQNVEMTVEVPRKNEEMANALLAVESVLLKHADGALNRAMDSRK